MIVQWLVFSPVEAEIRVRFSVTAPFSHYIYISQNNKLFMTKLGWQEIGRKCFHLSWFGVLLLYHFYGLLPIVALIFLCLLIDVLRTEFKINVPVLHKLFKQKAAFSFNTGTLTLLGMFFCIIIYQKEVAYAVITMMAFGDAASGIIGRIFGKHKLYRKKSVEGTTAGLAVNIFSGFFFLQNIPILIITALVASLVELTTETLEDNFLIPVFAGLVAQVLIFFF